MSIEKIPGGGTRVRWRDPNGRQYKKTFSNQTEAKRFEAAVTTDMARGAWTDPRAGRVRFGAFASDWLDTTVHLKPATRVSYEMLLRRYVVPAFGPLRMGTIERVTVHVWVSQMKAAGAGAGTLRNAYRVLSLVLAEAVRSKLIAVNPAADIDLPRSRKQEMRFLHPQEIRTLAGEIDPRFRALVLTAGFTGLRWGELAALRVHRVDLLHATIDVRESVSEVGGHLEEVGTKTGERRTVPLPRFLLDELSQHLGCYSSTDGYVFTASQGGPLRHQNFTRRHYKPALRRAGLDPATRFHDLRHSAASIAINGGANVLLVQKMLGHASATLTLDTYAHLWESKKQELRESLDDAWSATVSSEVIERPAVRKLRS
jgi:integrase